MGFRFYDPDRPQRGLMRLAPDGFFAIKAGIEPLANQRYLVWCFLAIMLLVSCAFSVLMVYFYNVDTVTDTVISTTILQDYSCQMISPINSRTVTYTCHNQGYNQTPVPCYYADGFGGIFLDTDGSLYFGSSVNVLYESSIFFASYDDCMSGYQAICHQPPYRPKLSSNNTTYTWTSSIASFPGITIGQNGAIFIAATDSLFALNSLGGTIWHSNITTVETEFTAPLLSVSNSNNLLLVDYELNAYFFNGSTGLTIWNSSDCTYAPTILSNGILCVFNSSNVLLLAENNGQILWSSSLYNTIVFQPVVGSIGDLIYVAVEPSLFVTLNSTTGQIMWLVDYSHSGYFWYPTVTPIAVDENNVALGLLVYIDGTIIVALNSTGFELWNYALPGTISCATPLLINETAYVVTGNCTGFSEPWNMHAVSNGTLLWTTMIGDPGQFLSQDQFLSFTIEQGCDNYIYITIEAFELELRNQYAEVVQVNPANPGNNTIVAATGNEVGGNAFQYYLLDCSIGTKYFLNLQTSSQNNLSAYDFEGNLQWTAAVAQASTLIGVSPVLPYIVYISTYLSKSDHIVFSLAVTTVPSVYLASINLQAEPAMQICFGNNTMYLATNQGNLYAIYPDGTELWKFTPASYLQAGNPSPLLVDNNNGVIYFSTGLTFYAINSSTGLAMWNFSCKRQSVPNVCGQPLLSPTGSIYLVTEGNPIVLYNLAPTGQELWNFTQNLGAGPLPNYAIAIVTAAFTPTNTFVFTTVELVVAINATDGKLKWQTEYNGPPYAFANSTAVYFAANATTIAANTTDNESTQWSYNLGSNIVEFRVWNNGILYVATSTKLTALYSSNGTRMWQTQALPTVLTVDFAYILLTDYSISGTALLYSGSNTLMIISSTGQIQWSIVLPVTACNQAPVINARQIIFMACGNLLFAISSTGLLIWKKQFTRSPAPISAVTDNSGTLYVIAETVYSIPFSELSIPLSPSECIIGAFGAENTISLSNPIQIPGAYTSTATACGAFFNESFCNPDSYVFTYMQTQFCKDYLDHPPYSCTRNANRSLLEAVSLSFSFTQLIYTFVIVAITYVLWHLYEKRPHEPKGDANVGERRVRPQYFTHNPTTVWANPALYQPPPVFDHHKGTVGARNLEEAVYDLGNGRDDGSDTHNSDIDGQTATTRFTAFSSDANRIRTNLKIYDLDREEARSLLLKEGIEGTYLVRRKPGNNYAISIYYHDKVAHHLLSLASDGAWLVDNYRSQPPFYTLDSLITHFHSIDADDIMDCPLTRQLII